MDAACLHGPEPQHGGHVFALGEGEAWVEFVYDQGWGALTIHLCDATGNGLDFDEPPYLNLVLDDHPRRVEGTRDIDILSGDSPWVFEDDGLLGGTERARFHLVFRGKTYVPTFAHSHEPHAEPHADTPREPPPGVVLLLSPHARLVVDHDPHWGVVHLCLIDHVGRPRGYDVPPLIHVRLVDETLRLRGERGIDGAWTYEHDALLGEPDRARLQVRVDGTTYIPEFPYPPPPHDHDHDPDQVEDLQHDG